MLALCVGTVGLIGSLNASVRVLPRFVYMHVCMQQCACPRLSVCVHVKPALAPNMYVLAFLYTLFFLLIVQEENRPQTRLDRDLVSPRRVIRFS